jgi:putative ABC transport system permease protein
MIAVSRQKTGFQRSINDVFAGINLGSGCCNSTTMIRNFIKIAFRNMMRNKAYSFINIFGLSVGVACCLLLAFYIQDEMSYDKHHLSGENLYRVTTELALDKDPVRMKTTSAPIVWGIKDEIGEFEAVARLVNPPGVAQNLIRYEANQFYESDGFVADSTLFDIFTYEFVEGNPKEALTQANSVVITARLAKKIFGSEKALDKIININQGGPSGDFRVTGVVDDKYNSHLKANFFVSMVSTGGWAEYLRSPEVMNEWAGQNFLLSYVKLRPGHNRDDVQAKMNTVFQKHGAEDLKALGFTKKLGLEPVTDIYLYAAYGKESPRVTYLYVIASIAVFILLIACINFMNLSTAKATKRANEVGLRKTLGAYRTSLIGQFLGEAMVIVVIAIIFSLVIVQLALPAFNQITGKSIVLANTNLLFIFSALAAITLVTGFVAGSYPAFYLSSFQPATVLKGKSAAHGGNSWLRRSLVVFQFVIAITLVCGMVVINKQLKYIQEKDLGFSATNKIVLPLRTGTAQRNYEALRNELLKTSGVNDATASNYIPGSPIWSDFSIFKRGESMEKAVRVRNVSVEPNFIDVLGIKLIAGRHLSTNRESDSENKIIVNREAARQLGFSPEKIIGEPLYFEWQGQRNEFEVIGVMEDYHHVSLKEAIYPLVFRMPRNLTNHDFLVADINSGNFSQSISAFESAWKTVNPETPFEYTFLDENVQKQYEEDRKVSRVISTFTVIAMIISCLGLYGLSTFMAERRFKEIGVRKVMGASVRQIVGMMSGEFVKLVCIAFVIAVPLAWYGINQWLEGFAYRTTPGATVFILSGVIALLIALLTVSFESIRAASNNPVNALRNAD